MVKRIVNTSFWIDAKVEDFNSQERYFMLYLLTNPFTTQLGIYELSVKQAAYQLGVTTDEVNDLLDKFENEYGIIKCSRETNEIAIKNYLRHSIVKGGAHVFDLLLKDNKSKYPHLMLYDKIKLLEYKLESLNEYLVNRKCKTKKLN